MRRLTMIVIVAFVLLLGAGALVAHYATRGEHNEPAQKVTVPASTG